MSYVEELRKLIGNEPIIMVSAAVLVFDEKERLLFLRRTDNQCWGVPGGAMEPEESLEETARRGILRQARVSVDESMENL